MKQVSIIIPILNEQQILPRMIDNIMALSPPADEILFIDGGSADASLEMIENAGFKSIISSKTGRAAQINKGVMMANGDIICILHADTLVPSDAITVIRDTMRNQSIALASFMPRICGDKGTSWGTSFHNWIKTWYAPLFLRPHLFMRGVRLLFGDHVMFFRRDDFHHVGGLDERISVMEEADLCISMARLGKIKMVRRWVWTSDRRIVKWGPIKANFIYFKVGIMWALGARERLSQYYPDIR